MLSYVDAATTLGMNVDAVLANREALKLLGEEARSSYLLEHTGATYLLDF